MVAIRRMPSLSTPDEPPLYLPFETCGLIFTRTSRSGWLIGLVVVGWPNRKI